MEKLSDLKLNTRLAKAMGLYIGKTGHWLPNGVNVRDGMFHTECDFCNQWNLIGVFIQQYKIDICHADKGLVDISLLHDGQVFGAVCKDTQICKGVVICLIKRLEHKPSNT